MLEFGWFLVHDRVEDFQRQADKMEQNINQHYEEMSKKLEAQNELSIRQEKLKAKEVTVKATKAELEELDKLYVETYEALKKKCTIA